MSERVEEKMNGFTHHSYNTDFHSVFPTGRRWKKVLEKTQLLKPVNKPKNVRVGKN